MVNKDAPIFTMKQEMDVLNFFLFNYSSLHFSRCIHSFSFSGEVNVPASALHTSPTLPYFSVCAPAGLSYMDFYLLKQKQCWMPREKALALETSRASEPNCRVLIRGESHSLRRGARCRSCSPSAAQ